MSEIKHAHFIRLRVHGPTNTRGARISATWQGWPSEGSPTVRRFMSYDYSKRDQMAAEAAQLFCQWLSDGWGEDAPQRRFYPAEITLADMGGSDWALLVHTKTAAEA